MATSTLLGSPTASTPTTPTRPDYRTCTTVSAACPVAATVLGYYPSLGASVFFAVVFGSCLAAALAIGLRTRTYAYTAGLAIGLTLEVAGYVSRGLMHRNPWLNAAFECQICCIILAPTFVCVSVYLTLKHVALAIGGAAAADPRVSRLPPAWYPRVFLPADLSCLIVQAIGGGVAAAAGPSNRSLQAGGNHAIIAGIALQVLVLFVFGGLAVDVWRRARRCVHAPSADPAAVRVWTDPKFRRFGIAVAVAYSAILIRCVYRIAEMANGWGNYIMQNQPSFYVLDPSLITIAVTLLTVFHPAFYFPQMRYGRPDKDTTTNNTTTPASSRKCFFTSPKARVEADIAAHEADSIELHFAAAPAQPSSQERGETTTEAKERQG